MHLTQSCYQRQDQHVINGDLARGIEPAPWRPAHAEFESKTESGTHGVDSGLE